MTNVPCSMTKKNLLFDCFFTKRQDLYLRLVNQRKSHKSTIFNETSHIFNKAKVHMPFLYYYSRWEQYFSTGFRLTRSVLSRTERYWARSTRLPTSPFKANVTAASGRLHFRWPLISFTATPLPANPHRPLSSDDTSPCTNGSLLNSSMVHDLNRKTGKYYG